MMQPVLYIGDRGRGTRLGRFVDLDLYLNNQKFPDVHKPIILIVVT